MFQTYSKEHEHFAATISCITSQNVLSFQNFKHENLLLVLIIVKPEVRVTKDQGRNSI